MRLTLVISSLGPGGAERVMSLLAGRWAEAGHEVTLVTLAGNDVPVFHQLDARVNLVQLGVLSQSTGLFSAISANLQRARAIRRAVAASPPEAILSFQDTTNVLVLLGCYSLHIPIIISDRVDHRHHDIGRIWSLLRSRAYPKASHLVVQTNTVLESLPPEMRRKATVIPNPVLPAKAVQLETSGPRPLLAAAGRLTHQKGFDSLLQAYALVADRFPDWTLSIFGEGEDRKKLDSIAKTLNISGRVSMPGKVDNLQGHLMQADAFVLSSRYEGFPNVLLEAMSCGLPCVATDCPSGPADIITHEHNGLLTPHADIPALAESLARLMGDKALRTDLGLRAKDVVSTYSMERIGPLWDRLMGIGE